MPKKTFKDNTAHLDRFFSEPEASGTYETHGTHGTQAGNEAAPGNFPAPQPAPAGPKYYRLNLKLKAEYKEYLERVSWEARKSITQYLNDLIGADKATKDA